MSDNNHFMEQKFIFIHFMDEARWKTVGNNSENSDYNYDIPNYANKKMPSEQKILTHFLGYITNRQTPFKLIFEQLDFIFSQLVADFSEGKENAEKLLLLDAENSYFVKNPEKGKEEKYYFRARRNLTDEAQYSKSKNLSKDKLITGASRFYPTDYAAIYCTLEILSDEKFGRNIVMYIKKAMEKAEKDEDKLKCVLYALWLLGYAGVGTWSTSKTKETEVDDNNILNPTCIRKLVNEKKKLIENFFSENGSIASDAYKEFYRNKKGAGRYNIKRATCFLRDLLKFSHFNNIFKELIGETDFNLLHAYLKDLELPGDVWNNNSTFRKCFLEQTNKEENQGPFNKIIRDLYDEAVNSNKKPEWYPEQFDVTFDFVPRMCDIHEDNAFKMPKESPKSRLCHFCPIYAKNDGKIPEFFCDHIENRDCRWLIFACGYRAKCGDLKFCPNK